jgi:hypothetical protein
LSTTFDVNRRPTAPLETSSPQSPSREVGSSGYQPDSKERAMDLAGLIVFASKLFITAGAAAAITAR